MKRLIIIVILIFILRIETFAQIQYAMVIKSPMSCSPQNAGGGLVDGCLSKNIAHISNAIIKIKGEDWYIKHIINNESSPKKISYSIGGYSDTIIVLREDRLKLKNTELNIVLNEVCEYLYLHKCNLYISNICVNSNNNVDSTKYIDCIRNYVNTKQLMSNQVNMEMMIFYIHNGFIGTIPSTTKFYYDRYYKKEIQQGNVPLSHIDWIKYQIDYYMNLHIESSLDYGIDNSAFEVKEKID